jgi:hypothetical protein
MDKENKKCKHKSEDEEDDSENEDEEDDSENQDEEDDSENQDDSENEKKTKTTSYTSLWNWCKKKRLRLSSTAMPLM